MIVNVYYREGRRSLEITRNWIVCRISADPKSVQIHYWSAALLFILASSITEKSALSRKMHICHETIKTNESAQNTIFLIYCSYIYPSLFLIRRSEFWLKKRRAFLYTKFAYFNYKSIKHTKDTKWNYTNLKIFFLLLSISIRGSKFAESYCLYHNICLCSIYFRILFLFLYFSDTKKNLENLFETFQSINTRAFQLNFMQMDIIQRRKFVSHKIR